MFSATIKTCPNVHQVHNVVLTIEMSINMQNNEQTEYKTVRGLTRGLMLLNMLNRLDGGASVGLLAELSGLHRTTVRRLLETLQDEGYVRRSLSDDSNTFQRLKPVYEGLRKIKFDKPRAAYKAEHEAELKQFYAARRRLTAEFPDGKVNMKKLSEEYDALVQTHTATYEQFKSVREDLQRLWKVKSCVDTAARFMVRTEEQMLQNRPQTRHKKEELSR